MDEIARYNQERWKSLVDANALFTRPSLDLDTDAARKKIDPEGRLGDLSGRDVLCLASGGGQQSVAFGILGANVTVSDLSAEQLLRDEKAAEHYDLDIKIVQADMRDLSMFEVASFDLVFHGYSINFVPEAGAVFQQVARVLRDRGIYNFSCANPFVMGIHAQGWTGTGYQLTQPYISGAEIYYEDQDWVYERTGRLNVPKPREFRHTLSDIINGLAETGFIIRHISDFLDMHPDITAEPGSWDHIVAYAPPWLTFWAELRA